MTTTAAGDAAVARLNKATEALEKIITGASNQVVDVPGYGNQPTLAGRVDERLDETTATAAAEADRSRTEADRATTQATAAANSVTLATAEYNKAKTQADRAQDEADRAAQITGLDTVADAIGMAALPLPDVWVPLSDSLRMITGYGRDVLVGSDVVARMVNFSRSSTATYIGKDGQLKTAAANEPRFEKEGLRIGGQSTNLFLNSENVAVWANPPAGPASTRELQVVKGGLVTCKVTATAVNGGVRQTYTSPAGGVHTVSFYLSKNSQSLKFLLENGGAAWGMGAQAVIAPATGTITEIVSITLAKSIPFLDGYIYQLTLPAGKAGGILNAEWRLNAAGDMYIGMPQLEALPFASSYIPTNGAAVTRAADIASLPQSLNLGESQLGFSLAVEFDSVNPGPYRVIALSDYSAALGDGANIYIRQAGRETGPFPAPLGKRNRIAYTVDYSGAITVCVNGQQMTATSWSTGTATSTEKISLGNHVNTALNLALEGHLRDLKIWTKKPLSADQLKVASA